jgi:periplasmic divalent cation tolerance protein
MSRSKDAPQVVLITAPDAEVGARIARALVEERLAACVNLVPGLRSIYRWEGRIEEDAEVLLVVKTRSAQLGHLEQRLRQLHPYDLPELISLSISGGSTDYLEWLRREVAP